jgi:serine/threonine-protein kinase
VLEPGTIFVDKYKIERQLGQGGMGTVFAATHLELADRVAIKVLRPEVAGRPDVVDRFLREARASVRLKGEHVARTFDVGRSSDGLPYIVMEYLEGVDLLALVQHRGRLPAGEVVDYVLQTCEAMAEAHAQAIVHRDIKPANLFVAQRPDGSPLVKVLDFGISKALDRDLQLTNSQATLGTPAYMSPEQLRTSKDVDTRTDIWSLGVVMFELLTGAQPFAAASFGDLVIKVVTEPAPTLGGYVPRALASAVGRCLERDPAARFQNVAELASAIAPLASSTTDVASSVARTHNTLRRAAAATPISGSHTPPPFAFSAAQPADGLVATTEMTSNGAVHAAPTATRSAARRGWIAASIAGAIIGAVAIVALTRPTGDAPGTASAVEAPAVVPVAIDAAAAVVTATAPVDAAQPPPVDAGVATPAAVVPPPHATVKHHAPKPPPEDPLRTRI